MLPSNSPVPSESTPMLASKSAPSRDQISSLASSGKRWPAAASQTQPKTSVSQLR